MESKATLKAISKDYASGTWQLVVSIPKMPEEVQRLVEKEIRLRMTRWTEKRSSDANRYFHKLCELIAEAVGGSKTEVKNQLIIDYGQFKYTDAGKIEYSIKPDGYEYLKDVSNHYVPTQKTSVLDNGVLHRLYLEKRGSHTYDTAEMYQLIKGTVNEAQELGIDTRTPDEIERMVQQWVPEG